VNSLLGTVTGFLALGSHLLGSPALAVVSRVDFATFWICAVLVVIGAVGVVLARNPVHGALMLIMTLFVVAVLFIEQDANFLAAVQVIVYAGAIVVLFLFVIMFLGVDRQENLATEPLRGQRVLAPILVVLALVGVLVLGISAHWAIGAHSVVGPARGQPGGDVAALGRAVFTVYLFPFEITVGLLVTAIVGAVVLARRPNQPAVPDDDTAADLEVAPVAPGDPDAAVQPAAPGDADVAAEPAASDVTAEPGTSDVPETVPVGAGEQRVDVGGPAKTGDLSKTGGPAKTGDRARAEEVMP